MELRAEARAVSFGLLAAAASFSGMLAGIYGSVVLLSNGYTSGLLATAAWLVFVLSIAPAVAVYAVISGVARLLKGGERAPFAAASAFLGGAVAITGSFLVNGLFLFVGWYLFPWTFAYAGMVLPHLLRTRSPGTGAVALHIGVATAVYLPWIALTLYNAIDTSAEMAGFREGAGWIENMPTAIVLSALYAMVLVTAVGAVRSPGVGKRRRQAVPSDQSPLD